MLSHIKISNAICLGFYYGVYNVDYNDYSSKSTSAITY